ncbi:MAG TPA: hypothetical protein IAB50_01760 [Candidatus Faecivicinus avistercoris]|nr:hypothetical protein [Candidatus Faecivicinus avistercoris]
MVPALAQRSSLPEMPRERAGRFSGASRSQSTILYHFSIVCASRAGWTSAFPTEKAGLAILFRRNPANGLTFSSSFVTLAKRGGD